VAAQHRRLQVGLRPPQPAKIDYHLGTSTARYIEALWGALSERQPVVWVHDTPMCGVTHSSLRATDAIGGCLPPPSC
jgi:hypothetical protein